MSIKKTNFQGNSKKPDIEVNKPPERKFRQKQGPFSVWYFIIMLFFLYLFQSSMQVKKEQIPYSQFQDYLATDQISECVIREKVITGTLRSMDQKTHKPRHFITVPLYNTDLARDLEKHGVKYSVVIESHFLSNLLFTWIIPLGLIFLLWGYLGRKMGSAGMNFLNIGKNKAHIHAETEQKVHFKDAAGVDEAKQELGEVIEFLRNPEHFQRLGGHMPKGVLLV